MKVRGAHVRGRRRRDIRVYICQRPKHARAIVRQLFGRRPWPAPTRRPRQPFDSYPQQPRIQDLLALWRGSPGDFEARRAGAGGAAAGA
jgi:hypothetical protein